MQSVTLAKSDCIGTPTIVRDFQTEAYTGLFVGACTINLHLINFIGNPQSHAKVSNVTTPCLCPRSLQESSKTVVAMISLLRQCWKHNIDQNASLIMNACLLNAHCAWDQSLFLFLLDKTEQVQSVKMSLVWRELRDSVHQFAHSFSRRASSEFYQQSIYKACISSGSASRCRSVRETKHWGAIYVFGLVQFIDLHMHTHTHRLCYSINSITFSWYVTLRD